MNVSTRAEWRRTQTQGLYEYRKAGLPETVRGVFYSRFSLGGRPKWRCLKTDVYEHAKIKHAQRMADVEKDRLRGAGDDVDWKTLGSLVTEMERRFAGTKVSASTAVGRANNIRRLKTHWRHGKFDTFLARNVDATVIRQLRDYLLHEAPWRYNFGKERRGFKTDVVNYTLWVLEKLLDIAVEKLVIGDNPFRTQAVLGSLKATSRNGRASGNERKQPKMNIPSRPDMARILAEIRRVPADSEKFSPNAEQRSYLETLANEMADHAELLAYSGMRKGEAQRSKVADDLGDEFQVWGTKSATSLRRVPVTPALRAVLDRIKSRRIGPDSPLVVTKEPYPALRRACDRLGLPRLSNHDLRHFFASACIASGVDVPTVSRWLGHADGGALCMKTYGHLLKDHSLAAAKKVDFSGAGVPAPLGSVSSFPGTERTAQPRSA